MNNVCAEFPNIKEKPSTMDASGTIDVTVSFLLNIKRQMNTSARSTIVASTASSFATALPISFS